MEQTTLSHATFGGGCFWCLEAVFRRIKGVKEVVSGYAGGHVVDPTYRQVCNKETGHAEVVRIAFDPEVIGYDRLLDLFWAFHDPTTKDRQGNDAGPQYRSIIICHDEEQKRTALASKETLDRSGVYPAPAVTEIVDDVPFYPAEAYHQGYYDANPQEGYCRFVIAPKVEKLDRKFQSLKK